MPIGNGAAERMQEQQAWLHQNLQRRGSSGQINFQGRVQVYDTHVDQRNCEMEMQIARNVLDNQQQRCCLRKIAIRSRRKLRRRSIPRELWWQNSDIDQHIR
jgi:hypothetical protein